MAHLAWVFLGGVNRVCRPPGHAGPPPRRGMARGAHLTLAGCVPDPPAPPSEGGHSTCNYCIALGFVRGVAVTLQEVAPDVLNPQQAMYESLGGP